MYTPEKSRNTLIALFQNRVQLLCNLKVSISLLAWHFATNIAILLCKLSSLFCQLCELRNCGNITILNLLIEILVCFDVITYKLLIVIQKLINFAWTVAAVAIIWLWFTCRWCKSTLYLGISKIILAITTLNCSYKIFEWWIWGDRSFTS